MSRVGWFPALLLTLAAWLTAPDCAGAQAVSEADAAEQILRPSPLAAKDVAKAKFAASRARVSELARARRAAADREFAERQKGFLEGRESLDILSGGSERLLRAELPLCTTDADRAAALAKCWQLRKQIESVNRLKYEAGRVMIQDLVASHYRRASAELELAKAKAVGSTAAAFPFVDPGWPGAYLPKDSESNPAADKWLAREKFEATRTSARQLLEVRSVAAAVEVEAHFRDFLSERNTLDVILPSHKRWAEAQHSLAVTAADRLRPVEKTWLHTRELAAINQLKYEAGRTVIQDYAQATYERLAAEVVLFQAWADSGGPGWGRTALVAYSGVGFVFDSDSERTLAKAMLAVLSSRARDLARAKREAARLECEAREQGFLAGRETLDIVLESSRRWLAADLALAATAADRLAAHERHWELMGRVEEANQLKYHAGRVAVQDYAQARHDRLDAEIKYLEAQKLAGGK